MRATALLITLLFSSHALAQDVPEPVAPLLKWLTGKERFEWPSVSEATRVQVLQQLGDTAALAFENTMASDEFEQVMFEVNEDELHVFDLNNDAYPDLIYHTFLGMNRGYGMRVRINSAEGLLPAITLEGDVVALQKNTLWLYQAPCCDGYVQRLQKIHFSHNSATALERHVWVQSNLAHENSLPKKIGRGRRVSAPQQIALYFRAPRPLFVQYSPEPPVTAVEGFVPFAQLTTTQPLLRLGKPIKAADGTRMQLIQVKATAAQLDALPQVTRGNPLAPQAPDYYYGWAIWQR